jgi:3-hydroxyisobutyrate dehydrogenase
MQTCDVVITMLSMMKLLRSFESENGLLSQDNPGKLIINMSTVSPETSRYSKICTARQVHLLMLLFPEVSSQLERLSYFGRQH